ncbi:MAG: gliding motility lipoprotein GldH [Chryseobacterium sp.]|nr:gliding motility lipoprotein GldH [Chryseobacterium sp.]
MHRVSIFLLLVLICFSCTKKDKIVDVKNLNNAWNKNQKLVFKFNSEDAQKAKNIIFVVRNNNNYPYSNLRLIVNFESPTKKIKTDTLNYILAKPDGEWIGTGFGETKEILFQYKLNYNFAEKGLYKINVTQAMRRNILPGLEDFGIKIESAKP